MSGGNSVVESLPSKQMVAGSSPVPRSTGFVVCGQFGLMTPREMKRLSAAFAAKS